MKDAEGTASLLGALLLPNPGDLADVDESFVGKWLDQPLSHMSAQIMAPLKVGEFVFSADFDGDVAFDPNFVYDRNFAFGRASVSRFMRYSDADEHLRYLAIGALGTGVSAVGVRGRHKDRIGVGFEDLSSEGAANLSRALKREFHSDVDIYETGRIRAHTSGRESHDPVLPGCSVSAVKQSFGTLGAVVEGAPLREYGMISNAHVLDQRQGNEVWQPRLKQDGSRPIAEILQVVAPAKDQVNTFDGGVAQFRPQVAHSPNPLQCSQGFGALMTDEVLAGTPVVKVGASSGLTYGEVDQYPTRVAAWYGKNLMMFDRQYQVRATRGKRFSVPGDSGAVIATEGDFLPFALLFGGNLEYTWATPLQKVLVSFEVSIVGG